MKYTRIPEKDKSREQNLRLYQQRERRQDIDRIGEIEVIKVD